MVPSIVSEEMEIKTTESGSTLVHRLSSEEIEYEKEFREIDLNTAIATKTKNDEKVIKDDEGDFITRTLYRQILRKVDVRLLPFAVIVYFFSQLDKHNLGQAWLLRPHNLGKLIFLVIRLNVK